MPTRSNPTARRLWLTALLCLGVVACNRDAKQANPTPTTETAAAPARQEPAAQRPQPTDGHIEGGFFVAKDAPPPLTCESDDDCTINTVLGPNGCCIDPQRVWVPQAKSYSYWASTYRQQHCDGVECPALPAPYPPQDCATKARCDGGTCRDRCGAEEPAR